MIAACYDLQLECDGVGCVAGGGLRMRVNITGEYGATCRRRAEQAGWKLYTKTGLCLCPSCVRCGAQAVT